MTSCTEGVCPSEPVGAWSNKDKTKDFAGHWTNVCATRVLLHLEVLWEGPSLHQLGQELGRFRIVRPLQRRGPPAELARRPLLTLGKSALPSSCQLQCYPRPRGGSPPQCDSVPFFLFGEDEGSVSLLDGAQKLMHLT